VLLKRSGAEVQITVTLTNQKLHGIMQEFAKITKFIPIQEMERLESLNDLAYSLHEIWQSK